MIISNEKFSVEYAERVMFRWSPNIIKIKRLSGSLTSVSVTVNDLSAAESVTFSLTFGYGNTIEIDISRALRALGGEDIEIAITGGGVSSTLNVYSINGARGKIERFGWDYSIRRWGNLPLSINFLFYQSTTLLIVANNGSTTTELIETDSEYGFALATHDVPSEVKTMSVRGQVFTGAWRTGYWVYNITEDCAPKNSIYLRWTDVQGLTWYWLFEVYDTSTNVEKDVEYSRMPDVLTDGVVNEWTTERSRIINKTLKIGANDITTDEYSVVKTLFSSSIVDAYDEDAETWYRVRVADGDYIDPKSNYKEVEFTVEFATINTQLP